jgi:carbonic anhydrase
VKESDRLLISNKAWATERSALDPQVFQRLAREQKPKFLWIGCSDSRVPANEVTCTHAGEIFVHRNIANVVRPLDLNIDSVLQYAIDVLQVGHVIVCGHVGCGGVRAAMGDLPEGPLGLWLAGVRQVYEANRADVDALPQDERAGRLSEHNVRAQVSNLARSERIRAAWLRGQSLWLHGWIYGLSDGRLRELMAVAPSTDRV